MWHVDFGPWSKMSTRAPQHYAKRSFMQLFIKTGNRNPDKVTFGRADTTTRVVSSSKSNKEHLTCSFVPAHKSCPNYQSTHIGNI